MKKIFINGPSNYANWLFPLGFKETNNFNDADALFLTGGTDVNPELYGHAKSYYTDAPDYARDSAEVMYYNTAVEKGLPIFGICRGHQFIAVMNGAKLVQHSSHPSFHSIKLEDGSDLQINSSHHQQVYLDVSPDKYVLLGWAEKLSPYHILDGIDLDKEKNINQDYREPEILWWPETKSLSCQGHCEWLFSQNSNHEFPRKMQEYARKYLL